MDKLGVYTYWILIFMTLLSVGSVPSSEEPMGDHGSYDHGDHYVQHVVISSHDDDHDDHHDDHDDDHHHHQVTHELGYLRHDDLRHDGHDPDHAMKPRKIEITDDEMSQNQKERLLKKLVKPPADGSEGIVVPDKDASFKMCGLKPPIHDVPANYLVSQGEVKMAKVWEYGVNIMMQRFTVELDYGDHCFHQPVMKDSHFVTYFKDYYREPVLATLFDSENKPVVTVYDDTGNLTMFTKKQELLHVCFLNDHYLVKKLFIVMEVEPMNSTLNNPNAPKLVQYENMLSTNLQRIDALVNYRIAQWTINDWFQHEYLSIMCSRSFYVALGTIIVLFIQAFFIKRAFEAPEASRATVNYRMVAAV